jgi:DNA-binding transcriptional ArsR family regulator
VTSADDRKQLKDPATMRALAHPARLALLEYLAVSDEGATATECATMVGLSPSATSYHLRALAKAGLIENAPGRGDGRERVWQARHRSFAVGYEADASPDDLEAETAMLEAVLARQNEQVRRMFGRRREMPPEWSDLSAIIAEALVVTPDELKKIMDQVDDLVRPYRRRNRPTPTPGAQRVTIQIRTLPFAD